MDLQRLGSVEQVREIKICRIVADDHVGIDLLNKVGPLLEHVAFPVELEHLRANDVGARVEGEHVSDEGFAFTCSGERQG